MNKTKAKGHSKGASKLKQNGIQQNLHKEGISTSTKSSCVEKVPATGKNGLINGSITEKCNSLVKSPKASERKNKTKYSSNKDCVSSDVTHSETILNKINSLDNICDKEGDTTANNCNDILNTAVRSTSQQSSECNHSDFDHYDERATSGSKISIVEEQNACSIESTSKDVPNKTALSISDRSSFEIEYLTEEVSKTILNDEEIVELQDGQEYLSPALDCLPSTSLGIRTYLTFPAESESKMGKMSASDDYVDVLKKIEMLEVNQDNSSKLGLSNSNTLEAESKKKENEELPQIEYVQYESELQMPMIMRIIQKDLSEPYSIYTYRYFIHNWPKLCFLAMCESKCVGAIVCKLDMHRKVIKRGYIAMLAVDEKYRKRRIGSTLVRRAIEEMISGEADEVVLETEVTNKPALKLYEQLGFVRDKRLFRYYLNGVDALRLKLWLR
ncbi:N-alpha-acetyltransferase 30 [Agrilus planipennis]|uniref:N-terminal methionine N(alpha)-acetyltransferase NatC n=1 Tax=Agrilus planipennis TaxID=224129 RepID=A0A1W4WHB8_AGRPL|nr:N-alpha-acetyltransferase 30 [Agrilus planipennis]